MIVTEQFVFIHVHKTAGQFINKLLMENFTGAKQIGYHYPISQLPQRYSGLPVIAFVRNPWDWYVSWYSFNASRPTMNPIFRVLSADGKYGFKDTIKRMLSLTDDTGQGRALREQLMLVLPESMEGNKVSGITQSCVNTMANTRDGYFSWLFRRMVASHADSLQTHIGKTESIRQELIRILSDINVEVSETLEQQIVGMQPVNTTEREHYSQCYDDGLRALVEEKDGALIQQYNYQFNRISTL